MQVRPSTLRGSPNESTWALIQRPASSAAGARFASASSWMPLYDGVTVLLLDTIMRPGGMMGALPARS